MAEFVGKYMALRDMFTYPGTHLYNIYITYRAKLLTIWVIYAIWGHVVLCGGKWRACPISCIYILLDINSICY